MDSTNDRPIDPPPAGRPAPEPGISRRLVLLLAVACGAAVANMYYAQPLLPPWPARSASPRPPPDS
jgi:hypothetical protein